MHTEEDLDQLIDDEGEPDIKPDVEPRQFEFKVDTSDLDAKIAAGVERAIGAVFARQAQQNQPADPNYVPQEINEDDDDQVKLAKRVHNELIPLKKEMAEFKGFGLNRLADLTTQSAAKDLPYYNDYKGEIDAELSKLDPVFRTQRETIQFVHNNVVARHINEITDRKAQEIAKASLQNANPPKQGTTGRGKPGETQEPSIPQPTDFFDEEQVRMIEERGGADAWARKMSGGRFADWNAYAKSRAALAATPRREGRAVIPFRRVTQTNKQIRQAELKK